MCTSLAKTSSDSLSSSVACVPRLASRTRILKRRSHCIQLRRKSPSALFCCSATPEESSARFLSFLRSSSQRRETILRSSASASLSSAGLNISESTCLRARFACEPTIARCSGSSQKSPRRRQESPDGLRRSWSTRCKSSTCAAVTTRSQTRCHASTQYQSTLRSSQSS